MLRTVGVTLLIALLAGCGSRSVPATPVAFTVDCPDTLATWPKTPQKSTEASPDLPVNRSVGRGVLVFRTCPECGARLLTDSGQVYRIPPVVGPPVIITPTDTPLATPVVIQGAQLDPMYNVRLSPDGRWLAQPGFGHVRLRDLTGTTVRRIEDQASGSLMWSEDGRWFVASSPQAPVLWDLETGTSSPINIREPYQDWRVTAVFGPHDVLLTYPYTYEQRDPDRQHETYVTVDPATGELRHRYPMDFGQDGDGVVAGRVIVTVTESTEAKPSDVVISDLFEGKVVARYPLPAETPARFTFWSAARVPGDGVLLVRNYAYYGPPQRTDPIQLFNLDPATGEKRLACTLPPMTEFVIRR